MGLRVDATPEEWASLLAGPVEVESPPDPGLLAPSDEVARVSRRIAGQYVEVLAHFAGHAFSGRSSDEVTSQAAMAVDALLRLADATGNRRQAQLLRALLHLLEPASRAPVRSRVRESALARLRDWLPDFAETLEPADAARLNDLVRWDAATSPLLDELVKVHGMGPKRLQRLYAAGLFTVDALAMAEPADVAMVTGIPRALAADVVETTRRYAEDEPARCVAQLMRTAGRLKSLIAREDHEGVLSGAARQALLEVEAALQTVASSGAPTERNP